MSAAQPSLLLLIDGYNVVAPAAPPGRGSQADWLRRERARLIERLARHLSETVRKRTSLIFDAAHPPSDRPHRFSVHGIDVRFAVGYAEADDLIEELIAAHSAPKRLAVVSSDHRIQSAAARRGCVRFDSDPWLDDLLDGRTGLAVPVPGTSLGGDGDGAGQGGASAEQPEKTNGVSSDDADQWMRDFGFD